MKNVAIIGQTLNTNFNEKISGGIQTVERLHIKIFLEQGYQVHYVTPSDSEYALGDPNLATWCYQVPSFEAEEKRLGRPLERTEKAKLSRSHAEGTLGVIQTMVADGEQPDLIINHSFSSSHSRLMAELSRDYPIATFVHNTPDTAMDIGVIAKVQHYKTITENNGALVCVSRYQRDLWRSALKKRISSGSEHFSFLTPEDVDKIYDEHVYPVYVDHHDVSRSEIPEYVVVTRPDPIKNLHGLLELLNHPLMCPLHLLVYLAHPGPLESSDYFREKIQPQLEKYNRGTDRSVTVVHNAPRDQVLASLRAARACFIPCTVEAAPVVLLEAASYGTPSIVFAKERDGVLGHAALDLLGHHSIWLVNVSQKTPDDVLQLRKHVETIDVTPTDRESLRDYTFQKHSFAARMDNLTALSEKLMARKQKKQILWTF